MKTLAIIGASYLQLPLVKRAKAMGIRTVCFAWAEGAVCKDVADVFYPISIVDKEAILDKCREEKVCGITSIASDVAVPTIAYVAAKMGLPGNSEASALKSTNKYAMRQALKAADVACPAFHVVDATTDLDALATESEFPLIVKPTDRSGSLGVVRVNALSELKEAAQTAIDFSFCKKAVVEQCITEMREISVEGISYKGEYHLLAMTDKVTTGAPHYVELGHHQPARLSDAARAKVECEVHKGVRALGIENGASHAEFMITPDGHVYVTEIGARMGGDFIGSNLVQLSTGYDFLQGVIECALGTFGGIHCESHASNSGVWFYAPETRWVKDVILKAKEDPCIVESELQADEVKELTKSADRSGYFIYASNEGRYNVPKGVAP